MRIYLLIFSFFALFTEGVVAQKSKTKSELLSIEKVIDLFPYSVKNTLGITYPIFRVYKNTDKSGEYYCVLTESADSVSVRTKSDTFNHNLKGYNFKLEKKEFKKIWEFTDFIIDKNNQEENIWFWSKYLDFQDYDKDGLIDPIMVYGTSSIHGFDDGRIKILLYYKGQKIAIRHQNGVLDFERNTQIDPSFYTLPTPLQDALIKKIELLEAYKHAIFPRKWQEAFMKKQVLIKN
jgi:hypothetical protein